MSRRAGTRLAVERSGRPYSTKNPPSAVNRTWDPWSILRSISRGRTGYVALYQYDAATDVVLVLAVRHQREAGFREL